MFNEIKAILINAWQEIKYIWVCEWHKAKAKAWTEQILRAEAEELEAQKKVINDWSKDQAPWYGYDTDWEEELEYQAQQNEYLDRISEADHAYDSYEGDNHPAHEKQ